MELNRIVDAIFRTIRRPPVGSAPQYLRPSPFAFPRLTPGDKHVLRLACEAMMAKDNEIITIEDIVPASEQLGVSRDQVIESVQVLGEEGLISISGAIGVPVVHFRITAQALERYFRNELKDYKSTVRAVAAEILNRGTTNSLQIANALEKPRLLVNHIMDGFVTRGYCKKSEQIGTHISVYDISRKFRRAFEECEE